jgi:hypothetical protein
MNLENRHKRTPIISVPEIPRASMSVVDERNCGQVGRLIGDDQERLGPAVRAAADQPGSRRDRRTAGRPTGPEGGGVAVAGAGVVDQQAGVARGRTGVRAVSHRPGRTHGVEPGGAVRARPVRRAPEKAPSAASLRSSPARVGRCRLAHPLATGRPGSQPRHRRRHEPGLEARGDRARDRAGRSARHLHRRTPSGRRTGARLVARPGGGHAAGPALTRDPGRGGRPARDR